MLKMIQVGLVAFVMAMGAGGAWAKCPPVNLQRATTELGNMSRLMGNYREAVKFYRESAHCGEVQAQFMLGFMYRNGKGVPQDYAEAAKWIRKAAYQGHVLAQFMLGVMYYGGMGVRDDYVMAHLWLNLSVTNGYADGAEWRDNVATEMTPAQIAEAQRRASACFNSNYRNCD